MDKIETALAATEDNAAAIRSLNNKLNAHAEKTADDIAELREQIQNGGGSSGAAKAGCATYRFITGTQVASNGSVTFGRVKSDGNVCAIVTFDTTAKRPVVYNNKILGTTTSPAVVRLPQGDADFFVASVTAASALVFYMNSQKIT